MHDIEDKLLPLSTSEHLAAEQVVRILRIAIRIAEQSTPQPSHGLIVAIFQGILDRSQVPDPDSNLSVEGQLH